MYYRKRISWYKEPKLFKEKMYKFFKILKNEMPGFFRKNIIFEHAEKILGNDIDLLKTLSINKLNEVDVILALLLYAGIKNNVKLNILKHRELIMRLIL